MGKIALVNIKVLSVELISPRFCGDLWEKKSLDVVAPLNREKCNNCPTLSKHRPEIKMLCK